jgi:Ca2+-binding RTX toxin-like protein
MALTREAELALLAAGSYWDIRQGVFNQETGKDTDNRAPIPQGWKLLPEFISHSGSNATLLGNGFSARAYFNNNTGEIVISYAGTEFGATLPGMLTDFLSGNIPLAFGHYNEQAYLAAKFYQDIKAQYGSNITFTGHSLGGGLASVMGVWFNRPAYGYAPAPFQASADTNQITNNTLAYLLDTVMGSVRARLGATIDPAFRDYDPATQFTTREANVQAWAVDGELLRKTLFVFNWIEGAPPTLLFNNPTNSLNFVKKHSIDLHAAALISNNFQIQASKIPNALELIFNDKLYGYEITKGEQNFLVKLLRNEVGIRSDAGAVLQAANDMLTHFANDLGKLAGNLAGLNRAAQDAILAQGIEWYYWQSNNYAGQEFLTTSSANGGVTSYPYGDSLLQYTTAKGDRLTDAENKAFAYTKTWVEAVRGAYSERFIYPVRVDYDQWNVVAGTGGSTATARDSGKSQIFIGQNGGDKFTGGSLGDLFLVGNGANTIDGGAGNDVIYGGSAKDIQDGGADNDTLYGGAGDDELTGGTGNDTLQGGAGDDTYQFGDGWGNDVITDSDGKGTIKFGDNTLGTAEGAGQRNVWVAELGAGSGQYVGLAVVGDGSSKKLIITKGADTSNTIIINNFDFDAATGGSGYLGIKLDKKQKISITQGSGTRRRSCVKSRREASNRYAFSSCLRYISLGCRPKTQKKSAVTVSARTALQ